MRAPQIWLFIRWNISEASASISTLLTSTLSFTSEVSSDCKHWKSYIWLDVRSGLLAHNSPWTSPRPPSWPRLCYPPLRTCEKKRGQHWKIEIFLKIVLCNRCVPHSQGLRSHVGLVDHRVGGNNPESAEQQDQEVLGVHGEWGHQPDHRGECFAMRWNHYES